MYIADKAFEFFLKVLFIIIVVIVVIIIIFSNIDLNINFEGILLGILEKFVDLIRSLFDISYDASTKLINNFKLP
jgi:Fe2+ transport system protein B